MTVTMSRSARRHQSAAVSTLPYQSGGSGGPFTDALYQNYTGGGQTGQYHRYASGVSSSQPLGLLLYFHGDGAYEFTHPNYKLPAIVTHAKAHNIITMSMLTPDSSTVTWWESGPANATYIRAFIQDIPYSLYNIDMSRIWLAGYSGGSQFITKHIMPVHSDLLYSGGSVVFGGGGKPIAITNPISTALKQNFHMHWYTGLDDTAANAGAGYDAISDAQRGYNYYTAQTMLTSFEWPAGINHDNIPEAVIIGQQLDLYA